MVRIDKENVKESNINHPLDAVQMRTGERDLAKAHMESAEQVADLLCGVASSLQLLITELGYGCRAVVNRVRSASGKTRALLSWD